VQKTVYIIPFIVIVAIAFFLSTADKERISYFWENPEKVQEEDITLLILGRVAEGQGGQWHAAPGLTDAIVIANYNPKSGVVNLVSLPRDLYGEFGGEEFKINEIYRRKKITDFMERLEEITSIKVENYLVVDVDIIEVAVDNLDGIEVEITEPVTDSVGGYRLEEGTHHLSGEDAIWLMRNRYSPQGDFFREKNQHAVIASIFNTFGTLSGAEKTGFLLSMVPHVQNAETNFSFGEIAPRLGNIGELTFNSIILDFTTGLLRSSYVPVGPPVLTGTSTEDGTTTIDSRPQAYVLIPTKGTNNYTAIREFIEGKLL